MYAMPTEQDSAKIAIATAAHSKNDGTGIGLNFMVLPVFCGEVGRDVDDPAGSSDADEHPRHDSSEKPFRRTKTS